MSYGIIVQVPQDVIDAINETAQQSPKLMGVAYKRATGRLKSRWLAKLRKEPPAASHFYPIHWQTAKQRAAFFATNGFGRGIPTSRTHSLSEGWQIEVDSAENGGGITVSNEVPYARFVIGDDRQAMFHGESGGIPWLEPSEINSEFLDEATDVLVDTWFTVADPFAGVKG